VCLMYHLLYPMQKSPDTHSIQSSPHKWSESSRNTRHFTATWNLSKVIQSWATLFNGVSWLF
jgi:hypothetical protein